MKKMTFLFLIFFLVGCTAQAPEQQDGEEAQGVMMQETPQAEDGMDSKQEETFMPDTTPVEPRIKEFSIRAFRFDFDPSTIEVNRGDTVKLTVESTDVSHGISIPQFGVDMKSSPGNPATAEFVADKAGTFPFFCNVYCGSGHGDMKGTLIVK